MWKINAVSLEDLNEEKSVYKSSLFLYYLVMEWIIKYRAIGAEHPPTSFPVKKWAKRKEVSFINEYCYL